MNASAKINSDKLSREKVLTKRIQTMTKGVNNSTIKRTQTAR